MYIIHNYIVDSCLNQIKVKPKPILRLKTFYTITTVYGVFIKLFELKILCVFKVDSRYYPTT